MSLVREYDNLLVENKRIVLVYLLYFLIIPFGFSHQITYWITILVGPFLLLKKAYKINLNPYSNKLIISYGLTILVVLLTGVLSNNIYRPLQILLIMISVLLSIRFICYRLVNITELICMLYGIVLTSLILSGFLVLTLYESGFFFTFPESGPLSKFGKNLVAPIIFSGYLSLFILDLLKFPLKFSGIIKILIYIFIMMTGAIKIILLATLVTGSHLILINKISYKKLIIWSSGIITSLILFFNSSMGENILETKSFQIMISRILILIGLGEYAPLNHLNVVNKRENLIIDTWEIFLENPFLGVGLENTRDILGTYSHNTFVELLAGGGVLLLITFLMFIFYALRPILNIKKRNIRIMFFIIFLSIIIMGLAQRIYDNRMILVLLSISVLLYIPINRLYKQGYEKK